MNVNQQAVPVKTGIVNKQNPVTDSVTELEVVALVTKVSTFDDIVDKFFYFFYTFLVF